MLKCAIFLCITISSALARSSTTNFNTIAETPKSTIKDASSSGTSETSSSPSFWSDFGTIYSTYKECSNSDLSVCLKLKLVQAIENASRSFKDIEVFHGVKFVKAGETRAHAQLSETEIIDLLPRSHEGKEIALTSLIWEKINSFFQSHTLQVKFPSEEEIKRSFSDEARKKKDKKDKGHMIMIPLLLGGTMIPMAYGALALLAGKALIVSKLALVLASIIGIKKLVSSTTSHHEASHEVVVSGDHGGWGREFDLAYNAYIPKERVMHLKPE